MLSVELGLRHKGIELAFPSVAELCFFTLLLAFLSAADFQFFTLHLINSSISSSGQYPC